MSSNRYQKREEELGQIKLFVDAAAGFDISTPKRTNEAVAFRTLYFMLAVETTSWGLYTIADMVNRNHATLIHARNHLFAELLEQPRMKSLVHQYKHDILGGKVTDTYESNKQYNDLKTAYNDLLVLNEALKEKIMELGGVEFVYPLTKNEKAYRKLTKEEQEDYDTRAELFLKSKKWKGRHNATFETIRCSE